ncbi:hypothetical protein ACFLSQ_00980 [Bacteroidota bacterium]
MKASNPPKNLYLALKRNAPSSTFSENYGRRSGYYGDSDEETKGYKAILIYIQLGLSGYDELIREIVFLILKVQNDYVGKYPIIPAAFGKGNDFIHEKKSFKMGFYNDRQLDTKISKVIKNLSGKYKSDVPAIIPNFFLKTDIRSLYHGKIKFEKDDLMVIIGKKDEVFFNEQLQVKFKSWMKKRILFVEIDYDKVNWNYNIIEPKFIEKEKLMITKVRTKNFKLLTFHGKLKPEKSSKEANLRNALFLIGSFALHLPKEKIVNIRIIGYEVPLDGRQSRGKCMDLLGYDKDFNPYIIELKIEESKEDIDKIISQINNYAQLFDEIRDVISLEISKKLFWSEFKFKGETKKILLAPRNFYKNHTIKNDKSIIYCSIGNITDIFDGNDNCILYEKFSSIKSIYLKVENK